MPRGRIEEKNTTVTLVLKTRAPPEGTLETSEDRRQGSKTIPQRLQPAMGGEVTEVPTGPKIIVSTGGEDYREKIPWMVAGS